MVETNKKELFRKKLRIALLGEPSLMSQNKVVALCEKFFNYGIEYGKSLNIDSLKLKNN